MPNLKLARRFALLPTPYEARSTVYSHREATTDFFATSFSAPHTEAGSALRYHAALPFSPTISADDEELLSSDDVLAPPPMASPMLMRQLSSGGSLLLSGPSMERPPRAHSSLPVIEEESEAHVASTRNARAFPPFRNRHIMRQLSENINLYRSSSRTFNARAELREVGSMLGRPPLLRRAISLGIVRNPSFVSSATISAPPVPETVDEDSGNDHESSDD